MKCWRSVRNTILGLCAVAFVAGTKPALASDKKGDLLTDSFRKTGVQVETIFKRPMVNSDFNLCEYEDYKNVYDSKEEVNETGLKARIKSSVSGIGYLTLDVEHSVIPVKSTMHSVASSSYESDGLYTSYYSYDWSSKVKNENTNISAIFSGCIGRMEIGLGPTIVIRRSTGKTTSYSIDKSSYTYGDYTSVDTVAQEYNSEDITDATLNGGKATLSFRARVPIDIELYVFSGKNHKSYKYTSKEHDEEYEVQGSTVTTWSYDYKYESDYVYPPEKVRVAGVKIGFPITYKGLSIFPAYVSEVEKVEAEESKTKTMKDKLEIKLKYGYGCFVFGIHYDYTITTTKYETEDCNSKSKETADTFGISVGVEF